MRTGTIARCAVYALASTLLAAFGVTIGHPAFWIAMAWAVLVDIINYSEQRK